MGNSIAHDDQALSTTHATKKRSIQEVIKGSIKITVKESFSGLGVKDKTLVTMTCFGFRCLVFEKRHLVDANRFPGATTLKLLFPFTPPLGSNGKAVEKAGVTVLDGYGTEYTVEQMRAFVEFMDQRPELLKST